MCCGLPANAVLADEVSSCRGQCLTDVCSTDALCPSPSCRKHNHVVAGYVQVIRCLLIEPYPESALNEEAGKLLLEDYAEYAQHARYMRRVQRPFLASACPDDTLRHTHLLTLLPREPPFVPHGSLVRPE